MSGQDEREGAPESYGSGTPFRPAKTDPLLQRAIPVAKELPGYRAPTARRDLLAGVTVAALAIPSAMAYAELAGLPAHGVNSAAPIVMAEIIRTSVSGGVIRDG